MKLLTSIIAKLQMAIGTVCLVIFVAATLTQVITRYIGISVLWTEEIAVNAFIWAILLGSAVMVREKAHFSFSGITHRYEGTKRSVIIILQNLIMLVFCILCSIYSIEIMHTFWNSRWITLPELKQGYVWLIMPVTFITSSIYLIDNIHQEIIKIKEAL